MIDFRLLGPLEAVENGRSLPLGGRQQRAVLATLLLHANELVSVERLVDLVWGERPPPTATTTIQVYVSRLRKALGREVLLTRGPGYLLKVAPDQVDLHRAERLIAAAQETREPQRRSALFRDAVALWQGAALADFAYDELGRVEAERLEEVRLTAVESAVDAELELGRHAELVPELEALVEEEPLRERVRAQLMLALYRSGRQADALSVYRDGRAKLMQELGLEPGPLLGRLERQILAHDPALDQAAPPGRHERSAGAREERKLVTALFAEVIEPDQDEEPLDAEEAKALLEPCFARIGQELTRFGASVETLIGDTVRAVFGAPVSHEDHAERAVRAGLAVRDLVTKRGHLGIRVGVSTGEALVRASESPQETGSAFGAVFGSADRLRSAAPANAVFVAESTYRATRQTIAYRRRNAGTIWEAVAAKGAIRSDRPHAREVALVGRTEELGLLTARIRSAAEIRAPALLTIIGAPGLGKSRLLRELATKLRSSRVVWLQGRSIPYGDGMAYWALAEAVKTYAGILDTDAPSEAEEKLLRGVARAAPDAPETVKNHLRVLLGLATGDVATERAAAFPAWREFLEGIAGSQPVVLALEDIHWADEGLLDFVGHVAESTVAPLIMLCTTRPELLDRRPGWAAAALHATTVDLSPLSERETRALIGALLEDDSLATKLDERVVLRVDGNPLFAEEYVHTLVDRGLLSRTDSGWQFEAGDELLPESVHNIIAARLDGLPPDAKVLLQDAAVIGKVFWPGSVAAIGGRSRLGCEAQLDQLVSADFVRRDDRSAVQDEAQYTFKHVLIRDVAYSTIPHADRVPKHIRVAEWIEAHARDDDVAELVAHHYTSAFEYAGPRGVEQLDIAERAVESLWRAGERARQLYANDDAAAYFQRALAILDKVLVADAEWRTELALAVHESLGDVLELTGNHSNGEAAFAAALQLAAMQDRVRRARLLRKQSLSRQLQRRIDDACDALDQAEAALGDDPRAGSSSWWQERCENAIQRLELFYFGSPLETFAEEFERVRPLVQVRGTPVQRSSLFSWHAMVALRRNRFITTDETLSDQRAALDAALESGNIRTIAQKHFSLGFGHLWANQLDAARTHLRDSLALAERVGDATTRVRCLNFLAVIERKRGGVKAARELASGALQAAQQTGKLEYVLQAQATLAWAAWRDGNLDLADEQARVALTGWDAVFQMRVFAWMPLWPLLGVALIREAESEATEHARTMLDPTRQPMPPQLESALASAVAAWDAGDAQAVRDLFKQAATLAKRDGYL